MKMGITEMTRMNFMALLPQQLANYLTKNRGEEDVTIRVKWSDLPQDLVIAIAGLLGLVDFVRFRCVCKEWTSASAPVAAKIESTLTYKPWFLLYKDYEDSGKCTLVTDCGKKFTMKLRQLIGTTCIASNQGWLLVFKPGRRDARTSTNSSSSIFFFRPVTKAKVVLPQLPFSELSNSVAAFSCPPTEPDCTVCIIRHSGYDYFKLHVLFRGAKNWMLGRIYCTSAGPIRCAAYNKQEFYFFDHEDGLIKVTVDSSDKKLLTTKFSKCVPEPKGTKEVSADSFYRMKNYCRETEMKQKLGLADYILSTCGTKTDSANGNAEFFFNERLTSNVARELKGVWIYPKFYRKSPKAQRW